MDEKQYIYGRLKFLSDEIDQLTDVVEQQSKLIGNLVKVIGEIQSPEYMNKQMKVAEMVDINKKIEFIRMMNKK